MDDSKSGKSGQVGIQFQHRAQSVQMRDATDIGVGWAPGILDSLLFTAFLYKSFTSVVSVTPLPQHITKFTLNCSSNLHLKPTRLGKTTLPHS